MTSETQPVRVVAIEPQPLYRFALTETCRAPGIELLAACSTAAEGAAAVVVDRPAVVLTELHLPDTSSAAWLRVLAKAPPTTSIVVLTADKDESSVFDALASGVSGYILKDDADQAQVANAVRQAGAGKTVISHQLHGQVAAGIRNHAFSSTPQLTSRESEVIRLIADGLSAPTIARSMQLSTPTIKKHMASLYDKLGVSDRAAAVAQAMRRGLVDVNGH